MRQKMNHIHSVNWVFFCTVLVYLAASVALSEVNDLIGLSSLANLILSQFFLVLPAVVYIKRNNLSYKTTVRLNPIPISTALLLILFAILITPLMNLISMISLLISKNYIQSTVNDMLANQNFLLCFIAIAIIPAICEESVYRGLIYNAYAKVSIRKGILLSGLLFGLFHMNFNQLSYAVVMGIIFAFLVEVTDSIVSTMIIHAVMNGYSLLVSKLLPDLLQYLQDVAKDQGIVFQTDITTSGISTRESILHNLPSAARSVILPTILACLVLYCIAKTVKRWDVAKSILMGKKEKSEEKQSLNIISVPLVASMVICCLFIILI